MAKKIKISQLPEAQSLDGLWIFGKGPGTQNVRASMSLLRGNTAFYEWQQRNPGKTYADWIKLIQEPAQIAADNIQYVVDDLTQFGNKAKEDESGRVEAEKIRQDVEVARKESETIRRDNEELRIENENSRVTAEDERKASENGRHISETNRKNAEAERVEAEQRRVEQLLETEKATERLNNLSDHRDKIIDDFWYRWNEITGEYESTGIRANGNVLYATFDINTDTGELIMNTPDNYNGPEFGLIGEDLYVEIN